MLTEEKRQFVLCLTCVYRACQAIASCSTMYCLNEWGHNWMVPRVHASNGFEAVST